jgi:hypothetical protein
VSYVWETRLFAEELEKLAEWLIGDALFVAGRLPPRVVLQNKPKRSRV